MFYFHATTGADTIADFESGLDMIDLSELSTSFGNLTLSGNGTEEVTVTVNGIDLASLGVVINAHNDGTLTLSENDFIF